MADDITHVTEPDPALDTSPVDGAAPAGASCMWNGTQFPEWYRVCRNGRVYQCLDGRWRNTGNSC